MKGFKGRRKDGRSVAFSRLTKSSFTGELGWMLPKQQTGFDRWLRITRNVRRSRFCAKSSWISR